jgi:hypothetical protein
VRLVETEGAADGPGPHDGRTAHCPDVPQPASLSCHPRRLTTKSKMSTSPALAQFNEFLSAGDFYSAHQKARTTATRLVAPPRRGPAPTPAPDGTLPFDTKAQEAASLLWEGARRLLEQGQTGSGADLAGFLVEVWKARGVACGPEERGECERASERAVGAR